MTIQTLSEQFRAAQSNIDLGRRRRVAQAAHIEIRTVLKLAGELQRRGLQDVLIGSYARNTGIWPGKDVDVFSKLTAESIDSIRPEAAYQLFLNVLRPRYGDRIQEQPRSIMIRFGPDAGRSPGGEFLRQAEASQSDVFPFSVDVVPAVRCGEIWAIPSPDRQTWQRTAAVERWVETNPEKLGDLTEELNVSPVISGQGAYVPTVKAVRQIRREHLGDAKPGGFYLELCVHEGFAGGQIDGDSWAEITASALRFVARRLSTAQLSPLCDPILNKPYSPSPRPDALAHAADVFARLASQATIALEQQMCPAAATWRSVFGANAKGPVFPLPPGCRSDGTILVPSGASNPLQGSDEARGFGGN